MGKRKRIKHTVFGSVEGNLEQTFINFLCEIYAPDEYNIKFQAKCTSGGTPDKIVTTALHECSRDKSFAWLDEDFEPDVSPLSQEVRERLAKCWNVTDADEIAKLIICPIGKLQSSFNSRNERKPTLIVSQPVCSESLILQTLGYALPYAAYDPTKRESQIQGLKNKLDQLMGGSKSPLEQTNFYRQKLTKEALEKKRRTIPELDLLISMLTK
jgi:hypothetical protein